MFLRQGFQGYTQRGWGYVGRIYVLPPYTDSYIYYKWGVRCEDGINSAGCLLRLPPPISADARMDTLSEFMDGPLVPLPVCIDHSVYDRTCLIRHPSLNHPLVQAGAWGSDS